LLDLLSLKAQVVPNPLDSGYYYFRFFFASISVTGYSTGCVLGTQKNPWEQEKTTTGTRRYLCCKAFS
jgi:hypothetical protein